jgi:hypothetical protein
VSGGGIEGAGKLADAVDMMAWLVWIIYHADITLLLWYVECRSTY